jgi:para-aminobenzoate synthetase component I
LPVILIEHGPGGRPALFESPLRLLVAHHPDEVGTVLAEAEAARLAGGWIAGYLSYEAGHVFEARLRDRLKPNPGAPLVVLGVFDGPQAADSLVGQAEAQSEDVLLAPLQPLVSRVQYEAAFARLQAYIGAGDCYQVNLTFPMQTRLLSGLPLGLYGALRKCQSVGFGAFIDLPMGPVIISRSPELFFQVRDGVIESRPMKGTAPRSPDAHEDLRLKAELAASEKVQAENLMIVDLLRNDIARVSQIGSVRVPELFGIESFATVRTCPEPRKSPEYTAFKWGCIRPNIADRPASSRR